MLNLCIPYNKTGMAYNLFHLGYNHVYISVLVWATSESKWTITATFCGMKTQVSVGFVNGFHLNCPPFLTSAKWSQMVRFQWATCGSPYYDPLCESTVLVPSEFLEVSLVAPPLCVPYGPLVSGQSFRTHWGSGNCCHNSHLYLGNLTLNQKARLWFRHIAGP